MRLAVIADIHGNLLALEAVLADIQARGVDQAVDLGDCVSGPLWPRETGDLLETLKLPTVRGNHDRQLCETPRALMGPSDGYAFDQMTTAARERLGRLPQTVLLEQSILCFHATPMSDVSYLLETITSGHLMLAPSSEITNQLGTARAPLMLCGHSHQPRVVRGPEATQIVNPGSVGCPAYSDGDHVSEAGSPHARYAMATRDKSGAWSVALISVAYDWGRASRRAIDNGRPDWAHALATGFMPA